jgi:YesN/AraC family two-component response regulator
LTIKGLYLRSMITSTTETDNILLIIDDEPDIRVLLKSIFELEYTILEAEDGKQGVQLAQQYIPNIIISDVMMPEMDGFEMCKFLKNTEATSHIPIILLTAKTDDESKLLGLQLGATDYITKPFLIAELKSKMNNLVLLQKNVLKFLSSKYLFNNNLAPLIFSEQVQAEANNYSSLETTFLNKINTVITQQYSNPDFSVDDFAKALTITAVQLRRKLKTITRYNVVEYIRHYRLEKAKLLLKNSEQNISEIAYATGFDSISYFSRVFQEQFKMSPSEYRAK